MPRPRAGRQFCFCGVDTSMVWESHRSQGFEIQDSGSKTWSSAGLRAQALLGLGSCSHTAVSSRRASLQGTGNATYRSPSSPCPRAPPAPPRWEFWAAKPTPARCRPPLVRQLRRQLRHSVPRERPWHHPPRQGREWPAMAPPRASAGRLGPPRWGRCRRLEIGRRPRRPGAWKFGAGAGGRGARGQGGGEGGLGQGREEAQRSCGRRRRIR